MKRLFALVMAVLLITVFSVAAMAADTTPRITLQLPLKSHLGQNVGLFNFEELVRKPVAPDSPVRAPIDEVTFTCRSTQSKTHPIVAFSITIF